MPGRVITLLIMAIYHQLSWQSRGRHEAPRKKTSLPVSFGPAVGLEFDTQVFAQVSLLIRETGCRKLHFFASD